MTFDAADWEPSDLGEVEWIRIYGPPRRRWGRIRNWLRVRTGHEPVDQLYYVGRVVPKGTKDGVTVKWNASGLMEIDDA